MSESPDFSIWIDADSCPVAVRAVVQRFSVRLAIPLIFVANHPIPFPEHSLFSMIVCEEAQDAADNYIVTNARINDLVITRDIPFAARLIEKGVTVINDRGTVFSAQNIGEKLSMRNFHYDLLSYGIAGEKTTQFGKKELNLFSNCLDRELTKKLKARQNRDGCE